MISLGLGGVSKTAALAFAAVAVFFSFSAEAAENPCRIVREAAIRMAEAPSFVMVQLINGQPGPMKVVGDSEGVHGDDGKKRQKVGERADFVRQMKQSIGSASFSKCAIVRTEKIDGKDVNVYTYRAEGNKTETMWVGKDDNRLYRVEDADKNGMVATY